MEAGSCKDQQREGCSLAVRCRRALLAVVVASDRACQVFLVLDVSLQQIIVAILPVMVACLVAVRPL